MGFKIDGCKGEFEWFELNTREEYLHLLEVLERHTAIIEYSQELGENPDDPFLKIALRFVRSRYSYGNTGYMYVLRADKAIFKRLREYESFFFNNRPTYEECLTDFGKDNDIEFYDKDGGLLFSETTHELEAIITCELLKELNNGNKKR